MHMSVFNSKYSQALKNPNILGLWMASIQAEED